MTKNGFRLRLRKASFIVASCIVMLWVILGSGFFLQKSFSADKTVTCPVDGKFHIVQAVICDPEGKPFLPRGINEFGGTTFSGFAGNFANEQAANAYVNGWKFNMFRIVTCPNGRCIAHESFGGQTVQGDSFDAIIQTYTSKKVVVMLDHHGLNFPEVPSEPDMQAAIAWYKEMANKYKDNPYVWLESFNEPVDGNDQIQPWANFSGRIIDAVRSVTPNTIVVINSGNYGQDTTGNGSSFDQGGSHILNAGPALAAKGNVVFDVHFYSRWSNVNPQGVKAFFSAIHNAGMAVFVGETWGDSNGPAYQVGDQQATDQLYAAKPNGVGILPWSAAGYPGVNGGRANDINSTTNPTNLTHNGQLHWNWTHSPPNAVPDGYTVTTGGGTSPTVPPVSPTGGTNNCPASKPKGDANCDGVPTLVDYQIWRNEFKGVVSTKTADFNGDGVPTLVDYQIWRTNFKGVGVTPGQPIATPTTPPVGNEKPFLSDFYKQYSRGPDPQGTGGYFGIGVWWQEPGDAQTYKNAGVNTYILPICPDGNAMNQYRQAGMKLFIGLDCPPSTDPLVIGITSEDEADLRGIMPDQLIPRHNDIKQRDGGAHPIYINFTRGVYMDGYASCYTVVCGTQPGNDYDKYIGASDIISADYYPIASGDSITAIVDAVVNMVGRVQNKKPVWNFIETTRVEANQWYPGREPTPDETEAEVWMSIVHGATGIAYFAHNFSGPALLQRPDMMQKITKVNNLVTSLANVINSPTISPPFTINSGTIKTMVKKYQGVTYVFAVNMTQQQSTINMSGVPSSSMLEMRSNATKQVSGGSFNESIEGYGTRVYKLQ